MSDYRAVAIGASAGGVDALTSVLRNLPASFQVPVFVTLHIPPHTYSMLPALLTRASGRMAVHPRSGDRVRSDTIYVAPPNCHMLVRAGRIELSHGPKENGSRPAVDPMLRTVARTYGQGTIAVVLTGTLDDGAAGMQYAKSTGAHCVVQDPESALYPGMPRAALTTTEVDAVLPLERLGAYLVSLVCPGRNAGAAAPATPVMQVQEGTMPSDDIQSNYDVDASEGTPSEFTCPDCGGVLNLEDDRRGLPKFRCQVGHAWSAESLMAEQLEGIEEALWAALRVLEEHRKLTLRMLDDARARNLTGLVAMFQEKLKEMEHHTGQIQGLLFNPIPSQASEPAA